MRHRLQALLVLVVVVVLVLLLGTAQWRMNGLLAAPFAATHVAPTCDEAGLNSALAAAALDPDPGVVTFAPTCLGVIALTSSKTINYDVLIDGGDVITLGYTGSGGHFHVDVGGELSLFNITLQGGNGQPLGGSVWVDGGTLIATNTNFVDNSSTGSGGAVYISSGIGRFAASIFQGNSTNTQGGAIYATNSEISIKNSEFVSNSAGTLVGTGMGGAVYGDANSEIYVDNVHFEGNSVRLGYGGVIAVDSSIADVKRSQFTENRAGLASDAQFSSGAGIYASNFSTVTIASTRFEENDASGDGGAIYANLSLLQVEESYFGANQLESDHNDNGQGGAIYALGMLPGSAIVDSEFVDNHAPSAGGALYQTRTPPLYGSLPISNSTFTGNSSQSGAAIFVFTIDNHPELTSYANISVRDNPTTFGDGAAISFYATNARVEHATITENDSAIETNVILEVANSMLKSHNAECIGVLANSSMVRSLAEDISCGNHPSNIVGVPSLGPLQNNGGRTRTQLPEPGSLGVDAIAASSCLPGDQRGVARPQNGQCDMGATELSSDDAVSISATATAIAQQTADALKTIAAQQTTVAQQTVAAQQTASAQQTATAQATHSTTQTLTPGVTPSPSGTPSVTPSSTPSTTPDPQSSQTPDPLISPTPEVSPSPVPQSEMTYRQFLSNILGP